MAEQSQLNFVDFSRVPARIWNSAEGTRIRERLIQTKKALGNNLERVDLYPNVGHVAFGTGEVLSGLNYHMKRGTPLASLLPFLGPLYQHFSVVDLGTIDDNKIEQCKKQWKDIIDPPAAKGSGIPGYGVNVHESVDLVEMYQQRGRVEEKQWFTSLGCSYPGYAIASKDKFGQIKLILAGGHEQLHKKLATTIASRTDLKIEDIADRNFTLDVDNSLGLTIKSIKDLQIVNHSWIAAKVMNSLGVGQYPSDPYNGFAAPVPLNYSCFYNTVHESGRSGSSLAQTFTVTQGVIDTASDLFQSGETETVNLYMIESPKKVHELSIHRQFLDKIRYFPVTTGSSEFATVGMSEKERSEIRDTVHWTGVSSIHNIGKTSYQPYDPTLKINTNSLFAGYGYAVVASEQSLEGLVYSVTGFDPRGLEVADYLKYTEHLTDEVVVKAPVNSSPVKLIFDTFPKVLDVLKTSGVDGLELSKILKTDNESSHYVQFPLASLRIADEVSKKPATNSESFYGLPRITQQ